VFNEKFVQQLCRLAEIKFILKEATPGYFFDFVMPMLKHTCVLV